MLTILPDGYGMNYLAWLQKDRVEMVEFIKKNNFVIGSIGRKLFLKPHMINVISDSINWTLAIYQFTKNHYFLVTEEIHNGINTIATFVYVNNKFMPTKAINYFQERLEEIAIVSPIYCEEIVRDPNAKFKYDFSEKDIVKITSTQVKNEETITYFKGNTIEFKVNKENSTFITDRIYWSNTQ